MTTSNEDSSPKDTAAQRDFFQSHPPSCLSQFRAKPAVIENHQLDGHGEEINSYWSIACNCGSQKFEARLYKVDNQENPKSKPVLVSPIELKCLSCGHTAEIFDSELHGYNPLACGFSSSIHGLQCDGAQPILHACNQCDGTAKTVHIHFEYTDDLFDEDFAEFKGKEMDLFSWFSFVTDCDTCQDRATIADFECA